MQYQRIKISDHDGENLELLNELALHGWRLVHVDRPNGAFYVWAWLERHSVRAAGDELVASVHSEGDWQPIADSAKQDMSLLLGR